MREALHQGPVVSLTVPEMAKYDSDCARADVQEPAEQVREKPVAAARAQERKHVRRAAPGQHTPLA